MTEEEKASRLELIREAVERINAEKEAVELNLDYEDWEGVDDFERW